jgi:hypothetical protein
MALISKNNLHMDVSSAQPVTAVQNLPTLVAGVDWGSNPKKRWLARAVLQQDQRYLAFPPEPAGEPKTLIRRLWDQSGASGTVLIGFDFPIGLPMRYAQMCAVRDFLALLPELGSRAWRDFYRPAESPQAIHLRRPFYPQRPGGARHAHLIQALGVDSINDLRRICELAYPGRRAAAPLFWTLGGQQVGKAAIIGWREVLAPALVQTQIPFFVWPFSGTLAQLLLPGRVVAAEIYPAEFYSHLNIQFPIPTRDTRQTPPRRNLEHGKRSQAGRRANAPTLLAWAQWAQVHLAPQLEEAIRSGFGPRAQAEDPFDALIALFGILNVLLGFQAPESQQLPPEILPTINQFEGWILGQQNFPKILPGPGRRQGAAENTV